MKFKILLLHIAAASWLSFFSTQSISQPVLDFSDLHSRSSKPVIIGQTETAYYCLYPNDRIPELVIYNRDLKEQSRSPWYSLVPHDSSIRYQPVIIKNNFVILLEQKTATGLIVKHIDVDENGKLVDEKTIVNDTTFAGFPLKEFSSEISKNNKYVLLYSGIKISTDSFMFKGYLLDEHLNRIKQFAFPVEKHETEDTWFGAMVDIEGNIQTLVFSAEDSWRKGTKIRIHTIGKQQEEMKSEQIEVGNKRLINYVFREDTTSHLIQLQATSTWQHKNDVLAGLSFISFPLQRNGRITYSAYDFNNEQKSRLAKNITNQKDLINNSMIESPSSFTKGGAFFTSLLILSGYPGATKIPPSYDNREVSKLNEFYMPDKASNRRQANSPYYDAPNQNSDRKQQDEMDQLKQSLGAAKKKNTNIVRSARLAVIKNTSGGIQIGWDEKIINRSVLPSYDPVFSFIKDSSWQMLAYEMDDKGPALFLMSYKDRLEQKKIEVPENVLLLLSDASLVNENTCLSPYLRLSTGQYGITRIVF